LAFGEVNEENVYNCVGHPSKNDMTNVLNWLLNDDFTTCYKRNIGFIYFILSVKNSYTFFIGLNHLKILKGYALVDLITEVHRFTQLSKLASIIMFD
jgi:replication factor C subunit 3/5